MQWMIASLSMQSNTDDAMANNCYPLKPKISETDDQHERLTSRHIETLGFLQEVVRENKRLKATVDELQVTLSSREELFEVTRTSKERIKKFQEECLQKIKKSKEELVKRHNEEIMKLVADKLETENVWLQERKKLQKQLNFYEKHNAVLTDQLSTLRKHSMQVDALNSKFDKALVQVEELRKENERLHTENAGLKADVEKLQTYEGRCEILSIELKDANQKNKELKFKASKLEKELATATSASQDSCLDKDKLKKRLLQLNLETEAQSKKGELQHQQLKDFQSQLMEKDAQLRVEQEERERLLVLVDTLNEELRRTRDLLDHRQQEQPPIIEKQSFKEYIRMKREMVSLREENNMLKGRKSKHHALPRLKIESPETRFHSTNGSAESKDRTQVYTKAHAPVSYTFNPLSKK